MLSAMEKDDSCTAADMVHALQQGGQVTGKTRLEANEALQRARYPHYEGGRKRTKAGSSPEKEGSAEDEPRLEVRMMIVFLNDTTLPCTPPS